MPCFRCGTRQTDPAPGRPSPWQRGVRAAEQVLVCPDCQRAGAGDCFDRCPRCGGTRLVRVLGETWCRSCAAVVTSIPATVPVPSLGDGEAGGDRAQLAASVDAAVRRVLGGASNA